MGKNDLIGGALWEQYSDKVSARMDDPKYRGEITEAQAEAMGAKLIVADWGAEACGDAVRLYWAVEKGTNKILDARFKSFGCGTAIASSDVMAEMCIGKTVDEAVAITNIDVEHSLRDKDDIPAIPPQKMHCSVMAYDVIKKAASLYKGVDMASFEEEEIVCECARVSLRTIRDVIRINDLKTVEEITNYTKAGAFCKSCIKPGGHEKRKYYLVDILHDVRKEMEKEKMAEATETKDFKSMTVVQRLKKIESVLEAEIKPILAQDGGSLEVVDIKDEDGKTIVYINYLGACQGCPGAQTGTLMAIQQFLHEKVDESIIVEPV
ncbi:MAG: iron-sulfur cluster assembly scaffold protein NifU [Spirochaetes bacterium GWF1_51_8]|nr:MAG: iron-sulfur cluster assembly scaffold protein NifU [Spirochaetes bacterium GWF1_51_8]